MKVAFVKVIAVEGLRNMPPPHSYHISAKVLPTNDGSYGDLCGSGSLTCNSVWHFAYTNVQEYSLCFSVFEIGSVRRELARLTLPLKWFPANAVTTDDYPLRVRQDDLVGWPVMATVMVHLSENSELAFKAPPGVLLVKPAWRRVPAPVVYQPVIYVAPQQTGPYTGPPMMQSVQYPQSPGPEMAEGRGVESEVKTVGDSRTAKEDTSLRVPSVDRLDETAISGKGNTEFRGTPLRRIDIEPTRGAGSGHSCLNRPLIDTPSNSDGGFLPGYPPK